MSLSSRGNERRGTLGSRIYAAYSDDDQQDVQSILQVLKKQKLDICDPHDALPNATVFKAWLEQGIYKSNITIIFLTKNFVRHNHCKFQADHAVLRYTKTKGVHRVLVVMLQSCKIPKSLRHFNCVYAWKFREEPLEQNKRIVKAISAPRSKFRRGSLLCYGMSANAQLAKKTIGDIQVHEESTKQSGSLLKYTQILFNLGRIKFALENCELKCTSENCSFRCSGEKIIDQFVDHVKACKYQKVRCRYCRQMIQRKNHQRHEESTCKRRCIQCPNESCVQKLTVTEMHKHARVCSYKEETCPNKTYGCTGVFARKDKSKHLEICEYETVECKRCSNLLFQVDIETHACEIPMFDQNSDGQPSMQENYVYKCYFVGCTYTGRKSDLESHQLTCECRVEQCADCGMRFPLRDLLWHRRQCDKIVECDLCHQLVPSSSKLTHDRWICNGQNIREFCEVCNSCVSSGRKENHLASCVSETQNSQTGTVAMPSAGGTVGPLPLQTNQSRPTLDVNISANRAGGGSKSEPPKTPIKTPTKTFEQMIYAVVPIPRSEQYSDDSDNSCESSVSTSTTWSPTKRNKWRSLMNQIDRNQNGLEIAVSAYKD